MRPQPSFPLKPHTVVVHKKTGSYYEIERIYGMPPRHLVWSYIAISIDIYTGELYSTFLSQIIEAHTVEPIAPTHPVYLKWAAARLRDALEGMDR